MSQFLCKKAVTARSSIEEIKSAIEQAGAHRLAHRTHDWPSKGEKNQNSWVKPGDIGHSSSRDPKLLNYLKSLAKLGHLETRTFSSGGARFRVK